MFLGDQHIVFSIIRDGVMSLDVFRIDVGTTVSDISIHNRAFECSLELPTVAGGHQILSMRLAFSSNPSPHSHAPFGISPNDVLFAVIFELRPGNSRWFNLFIPTSVVLSCLQKSRDNLTKKIYHWDEWGPSNTRMLVYPRRLAERYHSLLGWRRLARQGAVDSPDLQYEVYDFNPALIQRELYEDSTSPPTAGPRVMLAPTVINLPHFKDEITTSLPYHVTKVTIPREFVMTCRRV